MVIPGFTFARTPKILFGRGTLQRLPEEILNFGPNALLVFGAVSFRNSQHWKHLQPACCERGITLFNLSVKGEPGPEQVDEAVFKFAAEQISVVVAIGGGSVIDAGKAISAMLPLRESVMGYLEGVGSGRKHSGIKVPFIAVPTTSGTGTEATKNASLRRVGEKGFKKSLRHENFVPDIALIDPELSLNCPPAITAACGLDALAQLLESYVSPQSSPLTDALSLSGLKAVRSHLLLACHDGAHALDARAGMSYAALLSGLTLANAGLGIVHSLSSVIGGFFDIPHGVICGNLLASGTKMNIAKLKQQGEAGIIALQKHARLGALLSRQTLTTIDEGCSWLENKLAEWTQALKIPRLSDYGIKLDDRDKITAAAAMRNNPVQLERKDIKMILT
ncbi:iron-containing alcohol dehydrogenase, partial [bacterium]|nr:iron-containing alcohol dehydrogenase [bacterium]